MLIIIILLRWKHFVIISYLYKIPTINEPYNQRKRDTSTDWKEGKKKKSREEIFYQMKGFFC